MWLLIGIVLAVVAGCLSPFASRLQGTGLWAGKALAAPELATAMPTGLQDALTDGWPSWVGALGGLLPFVAAAVAFFHAWWAGLCVFVLATFVAAVASRLPIASAYLERYLALLLQHATRREADFRRRGDHERAAAAADLGKDIQGLLSLYLNTQTPAPSMSEARAAPFGDRSFLLRDAQR